MGPARKREARVLGEAVFVFLTFSLHPPPLQVMHMFKGCRREDSSPHIYAVAQAAYRNLLTTRQDQSIVLLGKSGSGKTTNSQHLVQYLVSIAGSTGKIFSGEGSTTAVQRLALYQRCRDKQRARRHCLYPHTESGLDFSRFGSRWAQMHTSH